MRSWFIGLVFGMLLCATGAHAYDPLDPANCNGADGNDDHALIVARVTATPRVNFVKSPFDDDFKATQCPAATEACRNSTYLVTGDLVLTGRVRGEFICVTYQSPTAKKHIWTSGWLPSNALTPVAPMPQPQLTDWIGSWDQQQGEITIKRGAGGKLHIEGLMAVVGANDVRSAVIKADVAVTSGSDTVAFVDDGSIPFEKRNEGECWVRLQRIGPLLKVEDNSACGGSVTFTGFFHRKK
ncbi:hypothetical protein JQ604_13160 [Bradyrhizobium jicamae]|uniref:hypothetical protein n=1 Tax=Bradyrhizobium jicamae TaxID=280332 RepID=UPI001BA62B4F|nr:hypothetical protein [Bradyrhizobium jicamae]MBR0753133.1 hypothetical protein [Bradyrhizobium jicamae]